MPKTRSARAIARASQPARTPYDRSTRSGGAAARGDNNEGQANDTSDAEATHDHADIGTSDVAADEATDENMPDAAEADRVGTIEAEEGHAVSGQDGGADATVHTTNANAEHAAEDSDQEAMLGEDTPEGSVAAEYQERGEVHRQAEARVASLRRQEEAPAAAAARGAQAAAAAEDEDEEEDAEGGDSNKENEAGPEEQGEIGGGWAEGDEALMNGGY